MFDFGGIVALQSLVHSSDNNVNRSWLSKLLVVTTALIACLCAAPVAAQNTLAVNTITDDAQPGNAANCQLGSTSPCTLRDAIAAANVDSGDKIYLSGLTGTITLTGGPLSVNSGMTIIGPGAAQLAISGANTSQVFVINSGVSASISGLTIANGIASSGGAINNNGTLTVSNSIFIGNLANGGSGIHGGSGASGGAILNNNGGSLTVIGSVFVDNSANSNSHGEGGAIYNLGTSAVIYGSTFSGNSAVGMNRYAGGGALCNDSGTMTVGNSTFVGNVAYGGTGTRGGAIVNHGGASLAVANSTLTGNSAQDGGGGIYVGNGTLQMANTVISGNWLGSALLANSYDDLDDQTGNATFSGGSGNVIGYYNAATSGTNPTQPASPAISLAPPGNYGGTTQTMLPLPGSPAICAGLAANVPLPPVTSGPSTDQRGWPINPSTCPSNYVDAGAVQTNYVLVNTLLDTLNNDATSCTDGQGNSCSLRDALKQTGNGMADIGFTPALFLTGPSTVPAQATITLGAVTTPPAGTTATDTYLPWIAGTVNLMGPGANLLAISGNQDGTVGTVLTVNSGASVNLYGLTIANGNGGLSAGGILNSGALTVANSVFSQNASSNPGSAIGSPSVASGSSTVTVIDSTFSGNTNSYGAISVPQLGLINSTVVGSSGYGIEVVGPTSIVNSTIVDNSSGGIWVGGPLTLNNSIVAGNTTTGAASSNDCLNCGAQGPNNLIGLPSGVTNINQILGSLAYNPATAGVEVMIPLPDTSPFPLGVVCQGSASQLPAGVTTDERGFPMDANCGGAIDLGAVQTNYTAFNEATYPAVIGQIVAPSPYIEVVESNDLTRTSDSVVGIPVTLSLSSNPSYLSGGTPPVFTTPVQTVNGTVNEAVFSDLVPNLPNTFPLPAQLILTWTAGNWTGTMPLTVDTAQVTHLGFTTPPAPTMAAGAAQTIVVQEETLQGGWLTSGNDSITLTVSGSNSYSQSYTTTAVNGAASFTQPVPTIAGQYSYSLADNTNTQVGLQAPVTQLVTGLSNAGILTATAGTPQSAYITVGFATPLTVAVSDLYGNPISGVNVTFAAPSSGASAALSATSCTTAMSSQGLAVCSVTATANGTTGGYTVTANVGTLTANFSLTNLPPPIYTVTTLIDDATGAAGNCNDTSQGAMPISGCSLRDAIAATAAVSTSTLTPIINFAATQNTSSGSVTLSTSAPGDYNVTAGGTLNIGANMNIVGPGSNLLAIDGGQAVEVFKINGASVSISGLTITNGFTSGNGGGIFNQGTLTIASCTISNNTANPGQGGGILNQGSTLIVANSTFVGNYGYNGGGGIYSWYGTQTVTDSTFSGNYGSIGGGLWPEGGALTMINSTISGNSGPWGGAGLVTGSSTILANVIIPDAIQGSYTDNGGNVIAGNINLALLGFYGGTTQTMPPLPGSAAICAGTAANATGAGLTTDQRGNPRSTTLYTNGGTACVDAGAVQTAYSLSFTTSPSNPQQAGTAFTPAPTVQLNDLNPATGQPAPIALSGAPITVALNAGVFSSGPATASTASNGVSTFGGLAVSTSTVLSNDNLIASAPAGSYIITANSSNFDIDPLPQSINFTMPGTAMYNGVSLTETLSATGGASGNSVIFTIDGNSTANIASIIGGALVISGPGTVIVDANQAGGGNYAAATQVQQTMLVTLDTPATIAVYSGSTQSAYVNTAFTNNVTALVTDASGVGVYGVTVTFAAPTSGASATLSSLTAVTGPNGQAGVTATANTTQGSYNVTASVVGVATSASFNLTNAPPPTFVVNTTADDTSAPTQQTAETNCPVNPTTTGAGSCTLRDALAAAGNAGTGNITFDPAAFSATNTAAANTITLGAVGTLMMPPYTTITGATSGSGSTLQNLVTVSGANAYTVFAFKPGQPTQTASISNLNIANGSDAGGVGYGGGIFNTGTLTLAGDSFNNNSAFVNEIGGGVYNWRGFITVNNGTFSQNSAYYCGGVFNYFGSATVSNSTFTGNSATGSTQGQGGAICEEYGALSIQNSAFTGNSGGGSVHGEGGAIYAYEGSVQVTDSTFAANFASGSARNAGGGAICSYGASISVTDSTFFGNYAAGSTHSRGGAIVNHNNGALTVVSSTFTGNSASQYGGGIYVENGTLALANTIVSGNWLGTASTPSSYDDLDDQSGNITFIGTPSDQGGNVMGYYNAFSATPLPTVPPSPAINLAPLANYGGPTQTMIPLPGSPAICAGVATPEGGLTLPASDQRGDTTTDPLCLSGSGLVDAGAVQTSYGLTFSAQPNPTQESGAAFSAAVTLTESSVPFGSTVMPPAIAPSVTIPVTLQGGGTLSGSSATTSNGVATYTLTAGSATDLSGLTLLATLPAPPTLTAQSSAFSLYAQPGVTGISPTVGLITGGLGVVITGTNLSGATAVNFGATPAASFTVTSPTQITATSPAVMAAGVVDVTVIAPDGTSATSAADQFTYVIATSTQLTPSVTPGSTFVWNQQPTISVALNPSAADVLGAAAITATLDGSTALTVTAGTGVNFNIALPSTPLTVGTHTIAVNFAGGMAAESAYYSASNILIPLTVTTPGFVVNTNQDDAGTAYNQCGVTTGNGTCTLRDALAAAQAAEGGNITFDATVFSATNTAAANTITLGAAGSLMMPPNTSITGPAPTVVNGVSTPVVMVNGTNGNNQYTVFTNEGSLFAAVPDSIANLAIANGLGGIYNLGGTLTVSNSTISGNSSVKGGGIYNLLGNLTVTGSLISNNTALNASSGQDNGKGGGIFNLLGSVAVQNSTFSGNSAEGSNNGEGGAIFTKDGKLQVSASTFTGNSTKGDSGDAGGGAICNTDSVVSVSDSTFFGNTTTGTELASGGTTTISQGGAILNRESSTLTLTNSTISANSANQYGGGIFNDTSSTIVMANTIVSGNWLGTVSTPSSYDDLDDQTGNSVFTGGLSDAGGNVMGYYNAFSATPLPTVPPSPAINLAPLATYGGPTQTMIPLPGSAAVCAGTTAPSGGLTLPSTDQRGDPNTNTSYPGFSATTPCVDAGAVQTNYLLAFTTQPSPIAPATAIVPSTNFQATVTLDESGLPFGSTVIPPATSPSVNLPLTLTSNPTGATLAGGSVSTVNGIANYSTLQVSAPGTGDTLTASLTLNGVLTPALALPATSMPFQVGQMTPTINWPTVSAITYGQALSASTLTGGSASYNGNNVPGTFTWTTPATIPAAGSQSEAVTFTPTDTTDYNGVAGTVNVIVATATLTVTASSATVNYGASLPTITPSYSGWQNGDTSTSLTTAPACSTTYTATSHPGSYPTSCSGAVDPNYTFSYAAGSFTVSQATTTITTLPTAPAITYGQALSVSTLTDGSASYNGNNVPGTFTWATPATIPAAGSQSEAVTFTPTDTADYQGATASIQITINQAPLTVTANNQSMSYDGTLPTLTGTLTGAVAGDGITALFTTTATASSPVGSYPITASLNDPNSKLGNYTVTNTPGTLTIGVVTPTLVLNCPTVTYDGNAHSCTGSASGVGGTVVSGTWSISPASETAVGSYPVAGIFTSTDANYASGGTASGTLVIQQAMPGVALTSSMNPALALNGVTLTATVSSPASVPSGSVTFYNGATALTGPVQLSNGSATLVTNSLPIGTDSLTAVYSGDANFVSVTSNPVAEVIEDFSLSISGSGGTSVTVAPGETATFNLTFNPTAPATTFPAAIQLTVTGLPSGATYGFTPASIAAGSGSTPVTLTITPPSQASTSKHQAPFKNPELPLALAILLIVPLSRRLRISARRFSRIAAPLLLMLAGGLIIAGMSGCGGNSSSSTQQQQPETYTITITGTSGALEHSTTVTLIVE